MLQAELAREAVRAVAHAREAARYSGVSWSGFAPSPYEPRSVEALEAAAKVAEARRKAWRASPAGKVLSAVSAAQAAAEAAHRAAEDVRAAQNRDGQGDVARRKTAAAEVEAQARALLAAARALRQAADG
jgi:hypothetical protein